MINKVIIDGYLGKNPELRKTQTGKSVTNVSICQSSKDSNGNQISKWFYITAWDKTAEYLGMYCRKGDVILIEAHVDYSEWEKDGQRQHSNDIIADRISIERYGQNHAEAQPAPQPRQQYAQQTMSNSQTTPSEFGFNNGIEIGADDLPF